MIPADAAHVPSWREVFSRALAILKAPHRHLKGSPHRCGLAVLLLLLCAVPAAAGQQPPVVARGQILVSGVGLQVPLDHQTVPRNIATTVEADLVASGDTTGTADPTAGIPADALVEAEIRGPAFGTPVTIVARPGEPLKIQPLAIVGTYLVENIRLVSGGVTLLQGLPDTVTIDVIDKVIVSQVTTRALTAAEIQQKGIYVDQTNFDVVNFTAAFGITGQTQTIDFPMILPKHPSAALPATAPLPSLPPLSPAAALPPPQALPQLQQVFHTNNISVSGLTLKIEDEDVASQFSIPPIPGVIIIPGNIAYLHQFFSVLLMVSNVAPGGSNLVVRDATATIVLPPGADNVPGSTDDPLGMARVGNPPVEQSPTQPVVQAGPDGKFGTPDDITSVAPGESGNSEFLVEGKKEGTQTVQIQISAMLYGLPIGPVKISGFATGVVEVRNPTFSLTLSHPATVTAGEDYDLLVTVTNTSGSPANQVSVNLSPNSISGAVLDSGQSVTLDSIAPHDAATASFHLTSQITGNVTATSFTSDDSPASFVLRTAVGALGIPLSPNSLVLPPAADNLPADVRMAGVGLLGQAFALATSPAVPAGLQPISQQIVYERATDFARAGQRLGMNDSPIRAAEDLTLDVLGNGYTRLAERFPTDPACQQPVCQQWQADDRGFDTLFRQSARGTTLLQALAGVFGGDIQSEGALAFQDAWAVADASTAPFITVATGSGTGGAPVVMRMLGPDGTDVGQATAGGPIARNLAFADFLTPIAGTPLSSQLIVDSVPAAGAYRVELNAVGSGAFDVGLTLPGNAGLRRVTFAGVSIAQGARATLAFDVGGTGAVTLSIDDNLDGVPDRTMAPTVDEPVVDNGPTLVSAIQVLTGLPDASQFGQVVGLLFSEELSAASSEDGLDPSALTNYQVDANQVLGASLQPGGRIVLLSLRDGVGPLVARSVTVGGVQDRLGQPMAPSPATLPIDMTIGGDGASFAGTVRAADGTPVPHARLQLSQTAPVAVARGGLAEGFGGNGGAQETTVTVKDLDATGRYSFDFVREFGLPGESVRLRAVNLDTGESTDVQTHISRPGQHLDVDIVFVGTGTLAGRALAPDGTTPLAGAVVKVSSLTRIGQAFVGTTDASGAFTIGGIPAGNFTIEAVHVATNSKVVLAGSIPAAGATVVQDLVLIPLAQQTLSIGSIRGQVFHAADNTPAAGVAVYTTAGGLATTDASGSYEIDGLPAGPVTVTAIDQAHFEQGLVATTIAGNSAVIANVLIVGGTGTVSGVVVGPTGLPIANALIAGGLALVRTDANGAFVLQDVPVGSRQVSALDETTQTTASATVNILNAGDTVNVRLALPGTGSIAGRVFQTDGVTPIPQLKVFILGATNASTVTDGNGGYRFDHLAIGAYQISAFQPDFSDGNIVASKVDFPGEVHTTNVVARGKGRVTGAVFAADGQTPLLAHVGLTELQVKTGVLAPAANPQCLGDISVGDQTIELPKCETVGIGFEPVFTRTADTAVDASGAVTGTFGFDGVFVGAFTVEAATGFSPAIMRAAGTIAKAGDTANVVLELEATSSVTGTVYQPDGVTHAGAGVVVTFDSGTLHNVQVVTDANGAFSLPLVNPGGFSVTAADGTSGLTGRTQGTVDSGATTKADVRLLGKGSVKVTVTGSNGPIGRAQVTVTRGTFPSDSAQGTTADDGLGSVTFAGGDMLTEGPFGVSAFDPATGVTGHASGTVTLGAETDVQVNVDNAAGTVHGRFLMPDGVTPIANAQVQITSARGQAFATTDAGGSFSFDGVFGSFTEDAFDPVTARRGRATGSLTTNLQDVVADITAVAQGTVNGVVRFSKDSSPAAAADVTLIVNSVFGGRLVTSTGVDGSFSFPGVSAGSVTVQARDPQTGIGGSATTAIALEGETKSVEIVLQVPQLGRVQGTVLRADGSPALGAQVTLSSGAHTTVDNAGAYAVDNVPIGAVTVTASAPVGLDGGVGKGDLEFDGDIATVNVTFIGTGTVSADVVAADGSPAPFATVALTSRDALGRQRSQPSVEADAQGHIQFTGIPVGDVSATAVDTSGLAGSASGTLAADGGALALQVTLQPSGTVHAQVFHEDKTTPAGGLAVELTGQATRFGSTAADGSLAFDHLALGAYQLLVADPTGTSIAKATVSLVQAGQTIDLGALYLHETPPQVLQIVPASGAGGVPVTQAIQVQFSEAIDPATVTAANLRVTSPAGTVAGGWALSSDGLTATFTPAGPYGDFRSIGVKVTTAVTDVVGRALASEAVSTFTTADSTPPAVVSRAPAPGARDVAADGVVRIGYSEAIDPARFAGSAISLALNGTAVAGRIDMALGNTVVVFTPAAPLQPNSTYTVTVLPAADVYGNLQPQGSTFTFATLDTIAPTISSLTSAGGTSIKAGQTATVTATTTAADVASVDLLVNGVVVQTKTAAPFTFDVPVTQALAPSFTVAARATDLSGNVGPVAMLQLTVAPDQAPTIAITSPAAGTVVDTGAHVVVSVHADDDVGVAQIGFQATGAAVASNVITVSPPAASRDATFAVDVPADAVGGSTITLNVAAIDTAGQSSPTSSVSLTVKDTTPPSVQITSPAADSPVDPGQTVAVTVAASDPSGVSAVTLQAAGAAVFGESQTMSPPQTAAQATFSVPIPATARPTDHVTLTATATDALGNASAPVSVSITIRDSVPPSVTLAIGGALTAVQPGRTIDVTVSAADDGGVAQVAFDASGAVVQTGTQTISPAQASASGHFSLAIPADAPTGGTVTLTGSATDASGNVGRSAGAALAIVADAPPTVHITSPVPGAAVVEGDTLAILADASDDVGVARVEFRVNGVGVATLTSPPYSIQQTVPAGPNGSSILIEAIATDTADQTTTDSVSVTLNADNTPPRVRSVTPPDGSTAVSIATPVTVTFTEPLDPATVTPGSFSVSAGGQALAGALALADANATVRFTPAQPLPISATITVALTPAIADRFGNPLADTNGNPLSGPLTFTFTTGAFAITSPAPGADVVERSHLVLEADGSASLGIATVVFAVDGTNLPAAGGPVYTAGFDVPPAAVTPTLTIVATARDAAGNQIAQDQVTVNVTVGLEIVPSITGVPAGGSATVHVNLSSALPDDLAVAFEAIDPAVAGVPAGVVLPAGRTTVEATIAGLAAGNTTVLAHSSHGTGSTIASVSVPASGQTLAPAAAPVGVALRAAPISAEVIGAPAAQTTLGIRLTAAPASADLPVTVTSSDDSIARVVGAPVVPAGRQIASLTVATGSAGVAALTVRAGSETRTVLVVVGTPSASQTLAAMAPAVGMAIEPSASFGQMFIVNAAGQQTTTVRLLSAPAAADTTMTVTSSNPVVASVSGPVIVRAGQQTATITIVAGTSGSALLTFAGGGEFAQLTVGIGAGVAAPPVLAEPPGVAVQPAALSGALAAPMGALQSIGVRLLAQPAASDMPVVAFSTDPSVATVVSAGAVAAGSQVSQITIQTGAAGTAAIELRVGNEVRELRLVVGGNGSGPMPAVVAPPVGVAVEPAPLAGVVISPASTAATVGVRLLSAPVASDIIATVTNSNPGVATVPDTIVIPAGQQVAQVAVTPVGQGVAELTVHAGSQTVRFTFISGTPPPGAVPIIVAPIVGVQIQP